MWTRVMAAAEPVKNPQGLVPFSQEKPAGGSGSHQKRKATSSQHLNSKFRESTPRTRDAVISGTSAVLHQAPLQVGQIGETDRRTAHRLKRGKLSVDARLDLHGCTVIQAHGRLLQFLRVSQATGARCVLVVTGKGRRHETGEVVLASAPRFSHEYQPGKLRTEVPRWLNESAFRPLVLSVSHAVQKDGGEGALYILLRKKPDGFSRASGGSHT